MRIFIRSRLFGAWSFSILGRAVSLVPLALIAAREDLADDGYIRLYIVAFTYIAAASYVLNTVNEALLFSKERNSGRPIDRAIQSIVTTVLGVAFLAPVLNVEPMSSAAVLSAIALQSVVAYVRTQVIDSGSYRGAYASTALRDLPAAFVALSALTISSIAVAYLPVAVLIGTFLQLGYLCKASARRRADERSSSGDRIDRRFQARVVLVAAGAICLASYQPLARLFAGLLVDPRSLSIYELADRPAYMIALAVAGGVGTEFQRRWRDKPLVEVMREVRKAEIMVVAGMLLAGLTIFTLVLLFRSYIQPSSSGLLLSVLPLCFVAQTMYLLAVLRTRVLLANSKETWVVWAYAGGLVAMVISWLGWNLVGSSSLPSVPISGLVGFAIAVQLQQMGVRRSIGLRRFDMAARARLDGEGT